MLHECNLGLFDLTLESWYANKAWTLISRNSIYPLMFKTRSKDLVAAEHHSIVGKFMGLLKICRCSKEVFSIVFEF